MEKIKELRKIFTKRNLDGYLIPKNDEFFTEYTPKHNDRLNFITDFSGSYGFALILKSKNYLFVDGRYTLQAFNQSGKDFKIITFPKIMPIKLLKDKEFRIGFDPKLFTKKTLNFFFNFNKIKMVPIFENLIDKIWKRKNKRRNNKFYILPKSSFNDSYKTKINRIINILKKKGADFLFISASENNAWLLNMRGRDTKYSPIPNGYTLIEKNGNISFFCNLQKISLSLRNHFNEIKFLQIDSISSILLKFSKKKFICDKNTCSIYFEDIIIKNNKILNIDDPIYNLKAIKTKKELSKIRESHIYDGIALTKYLFWLKKNFNRKKITEISASQKLLRFRQKNNKFKFLSFPTISATGPNGAIIHYNPSNKTNRVLKEGDVYLVDSGGQYEFGTTDVTRTISLNNFSNRLKNIYTRVLKGHLAVSNFKLKKNSCGSKIDNVARKFLKQIGLDYLHGTGHGVGYFLNVHEGPQALSKNNKIQLKAGMVVSNEPGYYEKGKFGIRIENLIYIEKNKGKNLFRNLTMVPIDKDLIKISLLNKNEKKWLNNYHKEVFNNLKNGMNSYELLDLKKACSAI